MGSVHAISERFKTRDERQDDEAVIEGLVGVLENGTRRGQEFRRIETRALSLVNEALRRFLERSLESIAEAQPEQFTRDGIRYKRHQPGKVVYHSLCGPLRVTRWTYRWADFRNSRTIVPLDTEAEIIEQATPAMAKVIALGYATETSRDLFEGLEAAHRRPPSRSTLEKIGKRIASCAELATRNYEDQIRRNEHVPRSTASVVVGFDRTAVAMTEDRPEGRHPKTLRKRRSTPRVRKRPQAIDVNWRMIYVGTVSFLDDRGNLLDSRRYATTHDSDSETFARRIFDDVRRALEQRPHLRVAVVQDGAPELWNLVRKSWNGSLLETKLYQILDLFHVLERLSLLLDELGYTEEKRKTEIKIWRRRLIQKPRSAKRMIEWLRKIADGRAKVDGDPVWTSIAYFEKNLSRMNYALMRRLHLPIGSGITESTCKTLIGFRAKRSGQRWRASSLMNLLQLRASYVSGRFHPLWKRIKSFYSEEAIRLRQRILWTSANFSFDDAPDWVEPFGD